jgi:hypothetical protein
MFESQRIDRLAAAAGLLSVIFFIVGGLIYGSGPGVADDPQSVVSFFGEHRDSVLWAMFVQGIAVLGLVYFMAALMIAMRDAGEPVLAMAAGLAFAVALTLGSAATMMRGGLAFILVEDVEPGAVVSIFHLGLLIDTAQNMLSAGFYLPIALAIVRTKFLPSWGGAVTMVLAILAVASTTAWNQSGFWSPDGAGFVNLLLYIAWVGGTSVLLIRR